MVNTTTRRSRDRNWCGMRVSTDWKIKCRVTATNLWPKASRGGADAWMWSWSGTRKDRNPGISDRGWWDSIAKIPGDALLLSVGHSRTTLCRPLVGLFLMLSATQSKHNVMKHDYCLFFGIHTFFFLWCKKFSLWQYTFYYHNSYAIYVLLSCESIKHTFSNIHGFLRHALLLGWRILLFWKKSF